MNESATRRGANGPEKKIKNNYSGRSAWSRALRHASEDQIKNSELEINPSRPDFDPFFLF
jgi:hypothetical protein